MGLLSYVGVFFTTMPFRLFSEKTQDRIIEKRKRRIVRYARKHSEYYKKTIPSDDTEFTDIPVLTKKLLLSNFDDILTDKRLTYKRIMDMISAEPGNGSIDKYALSMTSGSSGTPVLIVQDNRSMDRDTIADAFRCIKFRFPMAVIADAAGLGTEAQRVKRNKDKANIIKKWVDYIDSTTPPEDIVAELMKMQPRSVIGYTSVIKIVAMKLAETGGDIRTKYVYCSGEKVTDTDRNIIKKGFKNADVIVIYGCTEGGLLGYECKYHHLHLNSDLTYLEPVDDDYNPVPEGMVGERTLLTHFSNHIQPLIRYELGDKISVHRGCPCGTVAPWVTVEGRSDDLIMFEGPDGYIPVSPMNILVTVEDYFDECIDVCSSYQIVVHPENRVEFRFEFKDESAKERVYSHLADDMKKYLETLGIEKYEPFLSDFAPQKTTERGKHRRVLMTEELKLKLRNDGVI